jgi:hypothetical protein
MAWNFRTHDMIYNTFRIKSGYAFSCNGFPCDGYQPHVVDTLAETIKKLKAFYGASHVVLIKHSGEAIMSSIILGRYPQLVDGVILASTVYDVHAWAKKHQWNYANSLSPSDYIEKTPKNSFVYVISGEKDIDTYPDMSKKYFEEFKKRRIKTMFLSIKDGTHNSVVLCNTKSLEQAIHLAIVTFPNEKLGD